MTRHNLSTTRLNLLATGLMTILLLIPILSLAPRTVVARTRRAKTDKTASVAQTVDKAKAEKPAAEPISNFLVAAPYWTIEDGFVSTIEMRNNRIDTPLTVTPVLYPLHGQKITLQAIKLNPSESRLLNINEALGKKAKGNTTGAVEILYTHTTPGAFGASLTVLNDTKSLIYNFNFQTPDETSRLEGLWWLLDQNTDGFTAMQNASGSEIKVTPTLYVKERPYKLNTIRLRPHEMEVIHLRQELRKLGLENARDGGIQLAASNLGALIAGGGLFNPQRGFSAPLRMGDPQMLAMHIERLGKTLHAINVPIGMDMPDMGMGLPPGSLMNPIMSLRNVSDKTIRVQPVFKYEIGGGAASFTLPEVQLKPQQSKRVELLPFWKSGQIPEMVSWGSLEINYTGKGGSLIAAVSSIDQTGTYVFDAKIDNRLAAGFSGDYWSTKGDEDTAITIKNITNEPATCWLNFQYDRGRKSYQMQPLVLQAGEARMIDLKHLRMEKMPGINGELFPETATFGGLELLEEAGGRHFLIDAVVYNPKNATCGPCGTGCIYVSSIIPVIRDIHVAEGATGSFIIQATLCTGAKQDWSAAATYSEDHPEVAQITTGSPWLAQGLTGGIDHLTIGLIAPGPHCEDKVFLTSSSIVVEPKVNIKLNGGNVTGATTNVIVGQDINLSAVPVTAGATLSNLQWTVPGTRVADYAVSFSCATCPTSGVVTPLTSLSSTTVRFYWVDGGDGRKVTLTGSVNGQPFTSTSTFNVKRPTASITTSTGNISVDNGALGGLLTLHYGSANTGAIPGIRFTSTITKPSGFTGDTEWVQLVTSTTRTAQPNTGALQTLQGSGLDTFYPYDQTINTTTTDDSPKQEVTCSYTTITVNDNYAMWMMFRPTGTPGTPIWVPLRKVVWNWSGTTNRTAGTCSWVLNSSSRAQNPPDADSTTHPVWTTNVTQYDFQ